MRLVTVFFSMLLTLPFISLECTQDVNLVGRDGQTPLHLAAKNEQINEEIENSQSGASNADRNVRIFISPSLMNDFSIGKYH